MAGGRRRRLGSKSLEPLSKIVPPDFAFSRREPPRQSPDRDGEMARVAGERKKTVFSVEGGGLIVDRLHRLLLLFRFLHFHC